MTGQVSLSPWFRVNLGVEGVTALHDHLPPGFRLIGVAAPGKDRFTASLMRINGDGLVTKILANEKRATAHDAIEACFARCKELNG